jgi:hypothetical protein
MMRFREDAQREIMARFQGGILRKDAYLLPSILAKYQSSLETSSENDLASDRVWKIVGGTLGFGYSKITKDIKRKVRLNGCELKNTLQILVCKYVSSRLY